jgi:hypothetical protein
MQMQSCSRKYASLPDSAGLQSVRW